MALNSLFCADVPLSNYYSLICSDTNACVPSLEMNAVKIHFTYTACATFRQAQCTTEIQKSASANVFKWSVKRCSSMHFKSNRWSVTCNPYSWTFRHMAWAQWKLHPGTVTVGNTVVSASQAAFSKSRTQLVTRGWRGRTPTIARNT